MPPLDRDRIVDTAIDLLEHHGAHAISMRALATRFDVTPMALYRYFSDKDALLLAVVARISDRIEIPPLHGTPRERSITTALALHGFLVARPWLIRLISTGRLASETGLRFPEAFLRAGLDSGLDDDAAFLFYRTMFAAVIGQATYTAARAEPHDDDATDPVVRAGDEVPTVQRLRERWHELDDTATPRRIFTALTDSLLPR